jgi:L-serine/L-threonine ammonia-lyase
LLPPGVETWHDERQNVSLACIKTINSQATLLGASSPSARVVKMVLEREGGIKCVCPRRIDHADLHFFCKFIVVLLHWNQWINGVITEDHKMLVELACSTTLTPAYKPSLFAHLVPTPPISKERTAVFIVCGGFKISLDEMEEY